MGPVLRFVQSPLVIALLLQTFAVHSPQADPIKVAVVQSVIEGSVDANQKKFLRYTHFSDRGASSNLKVSNVFSDHDYQLPGVL